MHALRAETSPALPRLVLADGTVEALKWFALLSMTGEHVNKYLFNGTIDWLFDAGRLCLPIFVFGLSGFLC